MNERHKCIVCDNPLVGSWTDYHGEIECYSCGTPYMILHYDENKNRIEKPPECGATDHAIEGLKRYWAETKRRAPGGTFMGRYQGVANAEDIAAWKEWNKRNPDVFTGEPTANPVTPERKDVE